MTPEQVAIIQRLPAEDRPMAENIFRLLDKIRDDMAFCAARLACPCPCHQVIQPGLVPCPQCATDPDHSSRDVVGNRGPTTDSRA